MQIRFPCVMEMQWNYQTKRMVPFFFFWNMEMETITNQKLTTYRKIMFMLVWRIYNTYCEGKEFQKNLSFKREKQWGILKNSFPSVFRLDNYNRNEGDNPTNLCLEIKIKNNVSQITGPITFEIKTMKKYSFLFKLLL